MKVQLFLSLIIQSIQEPNVVVSLPSIYAKK